MLDLVFTRRFAMGHRLIAGASERCALPHGHNEFVTVTLRPTSPAPLDGQSNMPIPFADAKARWHHFVDEKLDHALQLSETDPLLGWFREHEPVRAQRIVVTPGDPTTELLAALMMAKLDAFLADDGGYLHCIALKLQETPTNTVRLTAPCEPWLPTSRPRAACWWHRADFSIADV